MPDKHKKKTPLVVSGEARQSLATLFLTPLVITHRIFFLFVTSESFFSSLDAHLGFVRVLGESTMKHKFSSPAAGLISVSFLVLVFLLLGAGSTRALTIVSGPTLSKPAAAPLAATLSLTTDVASSVRVSASDGVETWERRFYAYATNQNLTLLGFKAARSYRITVSVSDRFGNTTVATNVLNFVTAALPSNFPVINLISNQPEKMEPGYTMFDPINIDANVAYFTFLDKQANVVWYTTHPGNIDLQQLPNGDLFYLDPTQLVEMNMLGQIVKTWPLPVNRPAHHAALPTSRGTFLYLSSTTRIVTNFPSSSTNPSAPLIATNVWDTPVEELSQATGQIVNEWSPMDMLDPRRISYLTFIGRSLTYGWDWGHANGVIEDPRDGGIIQSLRHQNAVIKFTRDGRLKWILGPHENWSAAFQPYLLTPVGTPFDWQYAQHAPYLTPYGTLLLLDNGNYRASPFDTSVPDATNYSRSVEYMIDETNMLVSQVWQYGKNTADRVWNETRGDADYMPETGNILTSFSDTRYIDGKLPNPAAPTSGMVRIVETTHELNAPTSSIPEVVFRVDVFDYAFTNPTYRGNACFYVRRVPDLYPVVTLAQGISNLIASVQSTNVVAIQGSFVAALDSSVTSLETDDLEAAETELQTFQGMVQGQIAPLSAGLADKWTLQAQSILDAIKDSSPNSLTKLWLTGCNLRGAYTNGKLKLQFEGDPERLYSIEISSDLENWVPLGDAIDKGRGQFEFIDENSDQHARAYYRAVVP